MVASIVSRYRAAYSGLPREIWVVAIVLFINRSGCMVIPFMTLYLTSELGMAESIAGRLISVYGLGSVVGAYFGGRLTKRIGAVRVQTVCLLLTVPFVLLLPVFQAAWSISLALFCTSVVSEAVRPASGTAVAQFSSPENRTRAFALQRLAANLGFSFGPAIGGVLATIDYGLLFAVDALTTLIGGLLMLGFFKMCPKSGNPSGRTPTNRSDESQSPLSDRTFVAFLGLILVTNLVFFQFQSTYPLYLRDHYLLSKPQIGLMFAVNTIVIVVFEMLLIDYVGKWNILRTVGWGSALLCLGFGLLPFGQIGVYCVLCMVVLTVGEMLSFPLSQSFVANRGEGKNQAMYLSWHILAYSVGFVLGPAIGTFLYQRNQDWVWYFGLCVAAAVLCGFYRLARQVDDAEE